MQDKKPDRIAALLKIAGEAAKLIFIILRFFSPD